MPMNSDRHDNRRGPQPPESERLRGVCFIPLDPVLDAFHGVMVEFYERGPGASRPYVVLQSAALSGNVITRITTADEATARRVYADLCKSGVYPAP